MFLEKCKYIEKEKCLKIYIEDDLEGFANGKAYNED